MGSASSVLRHRRPFVTCHMGQIFDRIKRITKSYSANSAADASWAENVLSQDDDELRRIIDELSNGGSNTSTPPPQSNPDIPAEVLKAHTILNIAVGAAPVEMKKAYRTAIARWHPDRFSQATATDHTNAQQRAREINAAYITLKTHYSFT